MSGVLVLAGLIVLTVLIGGAFQLGYNLGRIDGADR